MPPSLRHGPFTLKDAQAAGVSSEQLRGKQYRQLFRGVYASAVLADTLELRCRALLMVLASGAAFSHFTAAELYGVPVSHPLIHVSMSSSKCRPRSRAGLQLHESVPNADVTIFRNLPLTTPERTFLDLAGCVDRVELVIVGDALLRRRRASAASLRSTVERARGRRGVCLAREALPLLRDGVDSPMETRLRLLLVSAGLPCPEINTDIIDERGHWLSRPDLLYRDLKIAMEYEGDTHRTDKRQWRADMTRHEVLHDLGWVVLRFHADDILLRPHQTVDRVRQWIHVRSRNPSDARVGSRS